MVLTRRPSALKSRSRGKVNLALICATTAHQIQSLAVGGRASSCPLCQSAEQEAVTTCFQSPSEVKRVCTSFANWTVADMAFALTILAGKTAFSWVLRNIGGMLSFPSCHPTSHKGVIDSRIKHGHRKMGASLKYQREEKSMASSFWLRIPSLLAAKSVFTFESILIGHSPSLFCPRWPYLEYRYSSLYNQPVPTTRTFRELVYKQRF